ncbi:MAG: polysaccharide deacetylase family protein [Clostridia bacterium]|nr:polysaccharide deacetylase family protein [Clostridia bacterium]
MKKTIRILSALLAIAFVFALAACSGTNEPGQGGAGRLTPVSTADGTTAMTDDGGTESETAAPPPAATDGWASVTGSYAAGNLVYTRADGTALTDFSFLESASHEYMPDSGDPDTGSWYCGKTERDLETGEVTKVWDRSAETLALLEKYGVIYRGDESRKVCYFTFDCDYNYNGNVGRILDVLREKGVTALFVLNGQIIETEPELVKRMVDDGHIIGNHGKNHKNMARVDVDTFIAEIEDNNALLKKNVPGAKYMTYYRPPYGTVTEWDMALAQQMGLKNALYSWTYDDYHDDAQPDPAEALNAILRGLHPGCVYMFHPKSTTDAAIMGDVIDGIRAAGYEIETVDKIG